MEKTTCDECTHKKCQETGKPCREVELILRKEGIWRSNWIRPELPKGERKKQYSKWREIPFTDLHFDMETMEYYDRRTGRRKKAREGSER
jgi:hypothetical protein